MEINIGLDTAMVKASKNKLENLLADHFVLLTKTLNFHWNITGPGFHANHLFLEDLYKQLLKNIDEIAERMRALGQRPLGSLQGFLEHNRIKEHCENKEIPSTEEMFSILSQDFTTLAKEIRKDIEILEEEGSKDSGTMNLLEDIIEKLEKTNWMIAANIA